MANNVYKITVTNWLEHNPSSKKSYKKTLIANNMINDAHVNALPLPHRWLFFSLLLICGDHANDTVSLHERRLNELLTTRVGAQNALHLLQQYQLVTYEKVPLKNRIEEKRTEKKGEKSPGGDKDPACGTEKITGPEKPSKKILSTRAGKALPRGALDSFSHDAICLKHLANVTHKAQESWLEAYPSVDFIIQEIRRAHAWIETNPRKAPKDFARFMLSWLSKAYEDYRKGVPSTKSDQYSVDAHNERVKQRLRDQGAM